MVSIDVPAGVGAPSLNTTSNHELCLKCLSMFMNAVYQWPFNIPEATSTITLFILSLAACPEGQ